ncbi:hypothetical protein DXG03_007476 [Asterophora parasitica]|uniref:Rab-GAP TBC domain-containing protein n=1 Tax=Asterophora parasitica TaxID=117018 RepID=A0A9P7G567_9AGAR|nr:hypothetical protein DXG03_007476 [Asterophora parasitica]
MAHAVPEDCTGPFPQEKRSHVDWDELRKRSLQPGGFGASRVELWPKLLHVSDTHKIPSPQKEAESEDVKDEEHEEEEEHRDERQIRLDTDRSFVLYPVGEPADTPSDDKEAMQEKLNRLLVSIFRRRPKLNYFQGYHDIVSVLFLTLPEETQLVCAEKISLHRVRDSMGSTLEPVLGLLRVTKNLLRLVDLEYAESLERSSPLPFYALSNLLTLFAHDMPTLPLIQHVFDFILCRPPIAIVYLATVIILSRKQEIRRLEEEDEDEGMGMAHSLLSGMPLISDREGWKVEEGGDGPTTAEDRPSVKEEEVDGNSIPHDDTAKGILDDLDREDSDVQTPLEEEDAIERTSLKEDNALDEKPRTENVADEEPVAAFVESPSLKGESTLVESEEPSKPIPSTSNQPSEITLISLLTHADELYTLYPPTHPGLSLSSIMGPQSVVYTWSESRSGLPSDNEAEAMVAHPELIVYPYIELEEAGGDEDSEWEEKPASRRKQRERVKGNLRKKMTGKFKRIQGIRVERRTGTMVAGAVVVLGVAMAVYGVKVRGTHVGGGMYGSPGNSREWKKAAGWVGGALVGVTEKMFSGLGASTSGR